MNALNAESEVAECCFDFLYTEFVNYLSDDSKFDGKITSNGDLENEDTGVQSFFVKLEAIGYDVGFRFVERCTKDRPRLGDSLDVIKFLCKDFWIQIFKKQIDKLQTNHRGVYVLQDFNFRWLSRFSGQNDDETKEKALKFLIFPCGIIRGALANLGVLAVVNADITSSPSCKYMDNDETTLIRVY